MVGSIVTFIVAVAIVLLILKVLGKSVKFLIGVLVNAAIGFIVLFVLNLLGLGVAVNWISALIVGFLGVPGLILVLILQLGFGLLL
jgi:inhibitor of the pro-sigma K processing machinery